MRVTSNWAATASLTVCASLILAMHDASYRPAFVQIALTAMVIAKDKNQTTRFNSELEKKNQLPSPEDDADNFDSGSRSGVCQKKEEV
jgi:hypothetical protein